MLCHLKKLSIKQGLKTDILKKYTERITLQCDQTFLEAITTSGHIKLLHWAKNYHGISYQRIS